jgi:predicted nucleotidyltransferase
MNFSISDHLDFLTVHGSRAYGTNDDFSDLDVKGLCSVPKEIRASLFLKFDQSINNAEIHARPEVQSRLNPNNTKVESTVYSIAKFFQLAAAVNPNIIELLWVDPSDILFCSPAGERILAARDLFLSKKAKFSFKSYAVSQAHKIERHRKWLINPPKGEPSRAQFGLPETKTKEYDSIFKLSQKQIEHWGATHLHLDQELRDEIKAETFDLINSIAATPVHWGNWPETYTSAAIHKILAELNLGESFEETIKREHAYQNELRRWKNYVHWGKTRNPERAKLEEKCGFDCKYAVHLLRLCLMCVEILRDHKVIVRRPDAEELRDVRFGRVSYEDVMARFAKLDEEIENLYKTSTLRNSVDFDAIDRLYLSLL